MKKVLIILSVILNVVLLTAVVYIGGYRTDYFKRMHAKIMRTPYVPERADRCCVESWNNCIEKLDMQVDVVFFGDSHIAGGDFQKAFPEVTSINLGYIGDDTKGMLRRVEMIAAVRPKRIFMMGGVNGLNNQSLDDFAFWYLALVVAIQTAVPEAELYVHSILPVTAWSDYCDNRKIVEANAIIQRLAAKRNVPFLDIYNAYAQDRALPDDMSYDGLHLTEDAYKIWYKIIEELMNYGV